MSKPPFLALPSGVRAYRMATARGEFAVHDTADADHSGRTVLLLPGFTGSKEDFIGLLEPLARAGFRAVAVDGRGQYETGGPREAAAYTQSELARDVLAVVAVLGRGEPGAVHLLGHSLGGLLARAAVLRDAAPFASLTLLSSGPAAVAAGQQERVRMLLGALGTMSMAAIWEVMQELDQSVGSAGEAPYSRREAAETSAVLAEFLRRRWLANVPAQLAATGEQLLTEPDRVGELAALGLPFHVVSGAADDAWPVPLLDGMAERLGARRSVIAGTGHSPNAERPAETARALADFWLSPSPR
ncbi:alpha/beta fold hydrolase [Streptomyces qinglanensis]|uniref:Pimeloyl-ACP methyl ester carboxylesterase n=1 Tax=Streptomyces qinglanensis TaxID=943816 RepID=A0A1H9USV2_9ACTN|nr:alpha/beta hydrolase [Streptomyces qinglanensis]SES12482.1 Pimeloyl-ACP methyl ester carboxylesterase [Streptomyces qinglanensis]